MSTALMNEWISLGRLEFCKKHADDVFEFVGVSVLYPFAQIHHLKVDFATYLAEEATQNKQFGFYWNPETNCHEYSDSDKQMICFQLFKKAGFERVFFTSDVEDEVVEKMKSAFNISILKSDILID